MSSQQRVRFGLTDEDIAEARAEWAREEFELTRYSVNLDDLAKAEARGELESCGRPTQENSSSAEENCDGASGLDINSSNDSILDILFPQPRPVPAAAVAAATAASAAITPRRTPGRPIFGIRSPSSLTDIEDSSEFESTIPISGSGAAVADDEFDSRFDMEIQRNDPDLATRSEIHAIFTDINNNPTSVGSGFSINAPFTPSEAEIFGRGVPFGGYPPMLPEFLENFSIVGIIRYIVDNIVYLPSFIYRHIQGIFQVELPSIRETVVSFIGMVSDLIDSINPEDPTREFTPEELAAITLHRIDEADIEAGIQCSICFELCNLNDQICVLPCPHIFHIACLTRWLIIKGNCPLCRGLIRTAAFDAAVRANTVVDNSSILTMALRVYPWDLLPSLTQSEDVEDANAAQTESSLDAESAQNLETQIGSGSGYESPETFASTNSSSPMSLVDGQEGQEEDEAQIFYAARNEDEDEEPYDGDEESESDF